MTGDARFPTGGINRYIGRYIESLDDLTGKTVVDIPAGDGRASHRCRRQGATVRAFDLYPELMAADGIRADYADMTESIPVEDGCADYVICQEGIEHVPDQLSLLREFNRVLRPGGRLLLTTPNLSHLRARASFFLLESDLWRRMPPTEIDSVWFADERSDRIYFGHLFLTGVHRLQTLARIAGFGVRERRRTDIGGTSAALGMLFYPAIAAATLLSYWLYRGKNRHVPGPLRAEILRDHVRLNLSPTTLLCKHIFWVLEKEADVEDRIRFLKSVSRHSRRCPEPHGRC